MDWDKKWLVDFNAEKTQLVVFDLSDNTGSIDVKMDESVLEEKPSFKMLGLTFSSKLDWGFYITCKTTSKKIGALVCSVKFLSPEVALYLYKSTIRPCMEYSCHVRAGVPSCYLELLDKLQNEYVALLIFHLLLVLNPWLIVEMWLTSVFSILVTLVDVLQNWLNGFHFLLLVAGLLVIRDSKFSVTIPRCYKDVYVSSIFPHTAKLWNSLLIECFPLNYNLSGFKSRINRHLITAVSL